MHGFTKEINPVFGAFEIDILKTYSNEQLPFWKDWYV